MRLQLLGEDTGRFQNICNCWCSQKSHICTDIWGAAQKEAWQIRDANPCSAHAACHWLLGESASMKLSPSPVVKAHKDVIWCFSWRQIEVYIVEEAEISVVDYRGTLNTNGMTEAVEYTHAVNEVELTGQFYNIFSILMLKTKQFQLSRPGFTPSQIWTNRRCAAPAETRVWMATWSLCMSWSKNTAWETLRYV